jgi:DNA invertase Pin-like site-specific DNA recombinase
MTVYGYARVSTDGQTQEAQQTALRGAGDTPLVTKLDRLARSIAIAAAIVAWAGMAEAKVKDPPQPPSATEQAKPSKWKGWFGPEGGLSKWKGWFTLNPKKE